MSRSAFHDFDENGNNIGNNHEGGVMCDLFIGGMSSIFNSTVIEQGYQAADAASAIRDDRMDNTMNRTNGFFIGL